MVRFTATAPPSPARRRRTATGNWSFTPTGLSDGAHTIVASQTDGFGNTGTASLSFTLDTTAPAVAITSLGGPTNQASADHYRHGGSADAGATVTLLDGTSALGTATVRSERQLVSHRSR